MSGLIFMSIRVSAGSRWGEAGLPWSWWPAGCHQGLNVKNPSNGLNGVHQWLALPFDLACWLPLNTSVVVSHWLLPFSDVGSGNGRQQQLWYESLQPGTSHSSSTVKISTFYYFHTLLMQHTTPSGQNCNKVADSFTAVLRPS